MIVEQLMDLMITITQYRRSLLLVNHHQSLTLQDAAGCQSAVRISGRLVVLWWLDVLPPAIGCHHRPAIGQMGIFNGVLPDQAIAATANS